MSLRPSVRFEIFKRDRFTCSYCGRMPPEVILEVDHVVAVSLGGGDEHTNLLTACRDCNIGKSNKPLSQKLPTHAEVMSAEQEKIEQLNAYNQWLTEKRSVVDGWFKSVSDAIISAGGDDPDEWVVSGSNAQSVRRFLTMLPCADLLEAVSLADNKIGFNRNQQKAFRYFCGICWRKIEMRSIR